MGWVGVSNSDAGMMLDKLVSGLEKALRGRGAGWPQRSPSAPAAPPGVVMVVVVIVSSVGCVFL